MAFKIRKVEYFYCSVIDQPGEAYKLLTELEKSGINQLAFTAIPIGPNRTQLTLFLIMLLNLSRKLKEQILH